MRARRQGASGATTFSPMRKSLPNFVCPPSEGRASPYTVNAATMRPCRGDPPAPTGSSGGSQYEQSDLRRFVCNRLEAEWSLLVGHEGKTAGRDQAHFPSPLEEELSGFPASKAEMEAEVIDVKVDMLFHHLR